MSTAGSLVSKLCTQSIHVRIQGAVTMIYAAVMSRWHMGERAARRSRHATENVEALHRRYSYQYQVIAGGPAQRTKDGRGQPL